MQHPFTELQPGYNADLSRVVVTRAAEVEEVVVKRKGRIPALLDLIDAGHYDAGRKVTGVPVAVAAASFEREAGSNFALSPAQGDPLSKKSVNVPRGLGPYTGPNAWTNAQIDAYRIDELDKVGAGNWTWAMACFKEEWFNGFGYRSHGIHSPYLDAGTNLYARGKYTSDGHWDPDAVDQQLGVIPMMMRIIELRPQLALADSIHFPKVTEAPAVPAKIIPPKPVPFGLHNARNLQIALNKIAFGPRIMVDGSYGNETKHAVILFQRREHITVDGIAGTQTWAKITDVLAETGNG